MSKAMDFCDGKWDIDIREDTEIHWIQGWRLKTWWRCGVGLSGLPRSSIIKQYTPSLIYTILSNHHQPVEKSINQSCNHHEASSTIPIIHMNPHQWSVTHPYQPSSTTGKLFPPSTTITNPPSHQLINPDRPWSTINDHQSSIYHQNFILKH